MHTVQCFVLAPNVILFWIIYNFSLLISKNAGGMIFFLGGLPKKFILLLPLRNTFSTLERKLSIAI